MAYIIQETGAPTATLAPDVYVRATAANSGVVSYWRKIGGNLALPNAHNDLHFTLGVVTGDSAHFHATWHGNNTVSYYICTADQNTGVLTTTFDALNPLNGNGAQATAQAIAPIIYRAVAFDKEAFKKAKEKLAAQQKTAEKTGALRVRSLLGSALGGIKKTTKT